MKLNLGSGENPLEGYENLDRLNGQEVYPLNYEPSICEEIRASHVLEHFPHNRVGRVIRDWVSALKDGGVLKIAVPNFAWIAQKYIDGDQVEAQGFTMGGQMDENDYHKCIFDEGALAEEMKDAGLVDIKHWKSEIDDCASMEVSLNLQGTKPAANQTVQKDESKPIKVAAIMSVPRLGFMDNFFCAFQALLPNKITLRKHTGAFWGQCIERGMEECVEEGCDWILTIDYDSVFSREDVATLVRLAKDNPDIDAIAPIQAHRTKPTPLMTMDAPDGGKLKEVTFDTFAPDLTKIATAHFGLTLIRVESLMKLPKPWFHSIPSDEGTWNDDKVDDDIYFWRKWKEAGFSLHQANRVPIGHAELMIRWPDKAFRTVYQHPSEFYKDGKPSEVWK
jgi:hypothetical protein